MQTLPNSKCEVLKGSSGIINQVTVRGWQSYLIQNVTAQEESTMLPSQHDGGAERGIGHLS